MGQSATLYRISESVFTQLSANPSGFTPEMSDAYETFEKNFEGIIFLLTKLCPSSARNLIQEIFYPTESIGEKLNSVEFDIENAMSVLEGDSIPCLKNEKINAISELLNSIDKQQLLDLYDPKELNKSDVYPGVWHTNESPDQAFNRRHIGDGFERLADFFNDAVRNDNFILAFVG